MYIFLYAIFTRYFILNGLFKGLFIYLSNKILYFCGYLLKKNNFETIKILVVQMESPTLGTRPSTQDIFSHEWFEIPSLRIANHTVPLVVKLVAKYVPFYK